MPRPLTLTLDLIALLGPTRLGAAVEDKKEKAAGALCLTRDSGVALNVEPRWSPTGDDPSCRDDARPVDAGSLPR
jgi:hypothetical protein